MTVTERDVVALRQRLAPYIRHTPLVAAPGGGFVKLESMQPTGSFKVRGFFAAALELNAERLQRGLLTVSAGNAALACAHVARTLGVPCRVVMLDTAPQLKQEGVRRLGARINPVTQAQMHEWMRNRGWEREPETFIHPFADEVVIAGHGTLAAEILEDHPDVDRVLVAVGGGGLICGIAAAFAALGRKVTVAGVQSDGYPLWPAAFDAGGPVVLQPNTIAEGTLAPFDANMLPRLRALVDEWSVVAESGLRLAVAQLVSDVKVVAEGAGALAYAALVTSAQRSNTVAVLSGGNIDGSRLSTLLSEAAAQRDRHGVT